MKGRTPSLDTIRRRLPATPAKPPPCPSWLDQVAAKEWRRLAKELAATGRLTAADVQAFAMYCDLVARHRAAVAQIAADGLMIEGPRERMVRHPMIDMSLKLASEIRQLSEHFGLTPRARTRIEAPPANEECDEFQSFISGQKAGGHTQEQPARPAG